MSTMPDPGFLFMFGIYGKRPSQETVQLLRQTGACGVVLLARNIESPTQVRRLTHELVERAGRPLLFAIDHEGGWVLRFSCGVTAFPGNAALGRTRDPRLAYAVGRQMALELSPLGIGLNLAPVMDVATSRYNPGIGIRSFGADPRLVSRLGTAFIRGLQDHGVAACAKHFPGKGAATVDAHVALPTIRLPQAELLRTHLAPFAAAARAGVCSVMTSHVRCLAFDSKPATFSRRIVHGLVRERLKFDGAVISDDLCMGAVSASGPIPAIAWRAWDAGHDILMIAHDPMAQREAVELFRCAQADGRLLKQAFDASRRRIEGLLRFPKKSRAADPAAGIKLARRIAAQSVEIVRRGALPLPLSRDKSRTLVLFPDFFEVRERFTFENGFRGPESLVLRAFQSRGPVRLMRTPVESTDIERLRDAIRQAERIVFFCFEAMRFAGQRAALQLLNREAPRRSAACLLRSSFDLRLLDKRVTVLDARGYRLCQLEAVIQLMLDKEKP